MNVGDWAQSIIGGLSLIATLTVAIMVYRLERSDRVSARAAARDEAELKKAEEHEREQRALRREQHRDDYKAVTLALNQLFKIFEDAENRALTHDQLEESGFKQATETVREIAARIQSLSAPLNGVYYTCVSFGPKALPDQESMEWGLVGPDGISTQTLHYLLVEFSGHAVRQYHLARSGLHAIQQAREALSKEWGS